jgi:S-DNA-T family DNA segregation ATPase FtsK/SpoIIIE
LLLLPVAGMFVVGAITAAIYRQWLLVVPMVAMSGISTLTSIIGTLVRRRETVGKAKEQGAAYIGVLHQKRTELERLRQEQQRIRTATDPDLMTLLVRARDRAPQLWERRPEDADFLCMRLGIGDLPSTVAVEAPHPDMPDPRLNEAHAMESQYAQVPQVPVTGNVRTGPLGVAAPLFDRTGVTRALICSLVVHHSPDEVHLLAIYSPARTSEWQWLKWLPHTYALSEGGGCQYLANDSRSAGEVLKDLLEELHRRQSQLYGAQHGGGVPSWPWLVVIVEDYALVHNDPAISLLLSPEGRQLNATAIFMVDRAPQVPMGCTAVIESQPDGRLKYSVAGAAAEPLQCWPEYAEVSVCEQLARSLAPIRVHTLQSDTAMPTNVRLLNLLGVRDIDSYDVATNWQHHPPDVYLKVPIGERRGKQQMVLDLNHTGHGPHGLIAGTTGSGKSELVQTLVVALAMKHHPYDVGFVLVDFKGGGTFSQLIGLPHAQGMVTDLSGNLTERALVALEAEMDRRKLLFNDAGVNDIGPYQKKYWAGKVKEPLPRLVVIIDEFAELVTDYPDFMDGLIGIARVGRSLGVHLILATQSPAGVVKQQIWANAKFRICLRVESRQESQEMLHRPEAANLPRMPGRGYLQVGNNDVFELFQVARVAGRYRPAGDTASLVGKADERIVISEVSPLGKRIVIFDSKQVQKRRTGSTSGFTDIDVVVSKLVDAAKQMGIKKLSSPWPAPLPDHVALPDLLRREGFAGWNGASWVFSQAARTQSRRGPRFCRACGQPLRPMAKFCNSCAEPVRVRCPQCAGSVRLGAKFCPSCGGQAMAALAAAVPPPRPPTLNNRPWLSALLGLLDDPAHQRQLPLLLGLNEQDGQLIVAGAPGCGKAMWARTLIMSLAHTHTPDELHFYLLEFGGQALRAFENLPHVGGIFTPLDSERVQRLLLRLLDFLEERKRLCSDAKVDGLVRLRELQPGRSPAAIVVIATGFAEFRNSFQDEMLQLTRLIREGGPYGIHIVLMGDRAGDVPTAISSVVARRAALRMADADEYSLVLGTRLRVSKDQKIPYGRGWYGRPPLEFHTATPGWEKDESAQIAEVQQVAAEMRRAWQGARPEPIEAVPDAIPLSRVLSGVRPAQTPPPQPQLSVPLGVDCVRLRPALVDLVNDGPDFIVSGTAQGGKTTLLLTWALAMAELNSPQQVQFVLVSGRRNSLRSLESLPHVLGFCRMPSGLSQDGVLARLLGLIDLREKLLSEDLSRAARFPHIVVMIDDYDAFIDATSSEREVEDALGTIAKRGRDVEMHTIVAGPLPNMGAGFSDPVIKQLKVGRSGFVMRILDASEQNPLGLRVRAADIKEIPPGRGYVLRKGSEEMIQVATPGDSAAIADRVGRLQHRWSHVGIVPAGWPKAVLDAIEGQEARETAMT